jgi:hypothetical protein
MKTFTSEGIEKQDNADVIVQGETITANVRSLSSKQNQIIAELKIANVHFGVMTDQFIEEPP